MSGRYPLFETPARGGSGSGDCTRQVTVTVTPRRMAKFDVFVCYLFVLYTLIGLLQKLIMFLEYAIINGVLNYKTQSQY